MNAAAVPAPVPNVPLIPVPQFNLPQANWGAIGGALTTLGQQLPLVPNLVSYLVDRWRCT
jgi:hypothetical protein